MIRLLCASASIVGRARLYPSRFRAGASGPLAARTAARRNPTAGEGDDRTDEGLGHISALALLAIAVEVVQMFAAAGRSP